MMGLKNVFHACMLALAFTSLTVTALPAETTEDMTPFQHAYVSAKANEFEAFFFIRPWKSGAGVAFYGSMGGKIPKCGEYTYYVHENPVPANGDCAATGGHFDPYKMKGAQCTKETLNKCELGDMSGKFGKIKFASTEKVQFENIAYLDPTIALSDGEHSVLGRSLVIYDPSGARIACGNIEKIQIDAQTKFQKK